MAIRGLKRVLKDFSNGSVCVCGQRGTGKDLLMSNVAVRQGTYYSNIDYGADHRQLDFADLDIKNDHNDFVNGKVKKYVYPYEEGKHIFISDVGVYFPSQYCNDLVKKYPRLPYFFALSRQLGNDVQVHINTQVLNRAWDKLREQSDTYYLCKGVWKFALRFGIVVQRVRTYELYDSCVRRVPPFRIPKPRMLANKEIKQNYEIEKERYEQTYGRVQEHLLVYRNKSKYDSRHFKTLLENADVG